MKIHGLKRSLDPKQFKKTTLQIFGIDFEYDNFVELQQDVLEQRHSHVPLIVDSCGTPIAPNPEEILEFGSDGIKADDDRIPDLSCAYDYAQFQLSMHPIESVKDDSTQILEMSSITSLKKDSSNNSQQDADMIPSEPMFEDTFNTTTSFIITPHPSSEIILNSDLFEQEVSTNHVNLSIKKTVHHK